MRLLNSVLAILSNNRLCQVQSIAFSADPLRPITYTHSPDLLPAPSMATTVLLVLQLVDLFPFSIHPFTVTRRILKLVFCLISTWATLTCLPYPTHIIDSVVDTLICKLPPEFKHGLGLLPKKGSPQIGVHLDNGHANKRKHTDFPPRSPPSILQRHTKAPHIMPLVVVIIHGPSIVIVIGKDFGVLESLRRPPPIRLIDIAP